MDTDKLVSAVFIRNALWDQRDVQHHNRFVLDKLWDEVAAEMKTTSKCVIILIYYRLQY